jgi:uncharacterized protein (TIGR02266 family)
VDFATQAMFVGHRVTNIGRGGVFIEGASLPIDSEVRLRLQIDDDGATIEARGRVVWTFDIRKDRLVRGIGVKFVEIADHDLQRLTGYLAKLETRPKPGNAAAAADAGLAAAERTG